MVQKGAVKSALMILTKSLDLDAQRFSALALANMSSAGIQLSVIHDECILVQCFQSI